LVSWGVPEALVLRKGKSLHLAQPRKLLNKRVQNGTKLVPVQKRKHPSAAFEGKVKKGDPNDPT